MADIHLKKDGTNWEDGSGNNLATRMIPFVHDNGSFRSDVAMHVHDGTTWVQVYPPNATTQGGGGGALSVTITPSSDVLKQTPNTTAQLVTTLTVSASGGTGAKTYTWTRSSVDDTDMTNSATTGSSQLTLESSGSGATPGPIAVESWYCTVTDEGSGNEVTATIQVEHRHGIIIE